MIHHQIGGCRFCNRSVLFPSLVHSRVYLGESLVVRGCLEVMVEYDGVAAVMV